MRTALRAMLCLLVLVGGNGARLLAASEGALDPAQTSECTSPTPVPGWICVNGGWVPQPTPVPPPSPPSPPVVISMGETVTGTLSPATLGIAGFQPGVYDISYELTVPSDGFVTAQLTYEQLAVLSLELEGVGGSWPQPSVATVQVVAGGTYHIVVSTSPWDLYDWVPFILTTSFSSVAPPPVISCAPPDPFASLGGGTCSNGVWWPPGLLPPGANPNPPPPTPPPPTPTPSDGGCTTSDPFAALGGGTCFNGGWWPPGLTPPGANPNPAPPPPAPSPTSGGCTGSDPFVSLGGGTCFNGGWWPPGLLPLLIGGGGG